MHVSVQSPKNLWIWLAVGTKTTYGRHLPSLSKRKEAIFVFLQSISNFSATLYTDTGTIPSCADWCLLCCTFVLVFVNAITTIKYSFLTLLSP